MAILAMTEVSSWIVHASFLACVALIIHAILPRLPRPFSKREPILRALISRPSAEDEPPKIRWWSLGFRAALECAAIWIWLAVSLPLLAWMFWIGDNEHWFYHYAWLPAAIIAVVLSGVSINRIRSGNATTGYARIHLWVPLLLIALFGAVHVYEFAERINGTSADAAAQNVLSTVASRIGEPVRLVEDTRRLPRDHDPSRYKSYWIMGVNEPRGHIAVCKHGLYWWKVAHYEGFPPSRQELGRAREWLQSSQNRDGAVSVLRSVIENYPNTPAEAEAKRLLQALPDAVQ